MLKMSSVLNVFIHQIKDGDWTNNASMGELRGKADLTLLKCLSHIG